VKTASGITCCSTRPSAASRRPRPRPRRERRGRRPGVRTASRRTMPAARPRRAGGRRAGRHSAARPGPSPADESNSPRGGSGRELSRARRCHANRQVAQESPEEQRGPTPSSKVARTSATPLARTPGERAVPPCQRQHASNPTSRHSLCAQVNTPKGVASRSRNQVREGTPCARFAVVLRPRPGGAVAGRASAGPPTETLSVTPSAPPAPGRPPSRPSTISSTAPTRRAPAVTEHEQLTLLYSTILLLRVAHAPSGPGAVPATRRSTNRLVHHPIDDYYL